LGLRGDELTWQCRKLHNEELYDLYSPNIIRHKKKKTGALRINATLRRVRVTIIIVKKATSFTYYACVCSLRYQQCSAHALYHIICGLSGSSTFFHIIV
jgi:hypothetical protein